PLLHFRLVVVEVHLGRAADHVQVNHVLGLCGKVRLGHGRAEAGLGAAAGRGCGSTAGAHQTGKRRSTDGICAAGEELTARLKANPLFKKWVHGATPAGGSGRWAHYTESARERRITRLRCQLVLHFHSNERTAIPEAHIARFVAERKCAKYSAARSNALARF